MPKISIIVPVHNVEGYLRECLDSAVGQTLTDIELICIDDKSDDTSPVILREYSERDPRMHVITYSENLSASRARKDGVAAATGEYIMFLDGDDALELDACERLYASMAENPVDILHFGASITNEKALPQSRVDWVRDFVMPYNGVLEGGDILKGCFSADRLYNFSIWDKLYSADLCKRSFARMKPDRFPRAQDLYAYFVLSYYAKTYRGMPEAVLYTYHFGRGATGHSTLTMTQFKGFCSMALVADAIKDFLINEATLSRHETVYAGIRDWLLQDCVVNWNEHLGVADRIAGFELMLTFWGRHEVLAKIKEIIVPKISIIIPVYNMQNHLRQCMSSAVGQTLPDIEVICTDDHSDDDSANILQEFAQNDPRVRVITFTENRSVSRSRKEGVLEATGEYILFLDADDALETHACETLYDSMKADPVDILHFGTVVTNEANLPQARVAWVRKFVGPYYGVLEGEAILEGCFSEKSLYNFSLWDKLYSADLCKRSFARISDGKLPRGEDKYAYFVLSYFAKTYRGIPDEVLYNYHFGRGVTGHSLISLQQFEGLCVMGRAADAIRDFLIEEDALQLHENSYTNARSWLLTDCVSNWNRHLGSLDRAAGIDLMLEYWESPEVIAKIAKMNWSEPGDVARHIDLSSAVVHTPRKVRVVGTYFHRYENGGTERVLSILFEHWLALGYEVVFFTDDSPSRDDYAMPEAVRRVILPSFFDISPDNYLDRANALSAAIHQYEIDVMVYHAWVSPILLWDLLVCKTAGTAFVTHCHNVFSQPVMSNHAYFADMPPIYRLNDAVVALSEVDRTYWSNFNDTVIPVVNPLTFDLHDLELAPLENKNVLWLGRLSNEKRPHDALRIFAKVLEGEPEAKFFMVGSSSDPEYTDGLYELITELGIRDSVTMCGFQKDVMPFYKMASVVLLTSEYEGFLMVLSEGQSLGLPFVMYDLPYLTLTRSRKGFVGIERGDVGAAADAVIDLLKDPEYRKSMGRDARANVEEVARFDIGEAWREILDGLSRPIVQQPVNEDARIMWETLLDHYRTGVQAHAHELYSRDKELAKRYELLHEANVLRGARYKELQQRNKDLSAARAELKSTNLEMDKLKDSLAAARKAQKKLRSSRSFRIGYAITSIPRTIRRSLRGPGSREE